MPCRPPEDVKEIGKYMSLELRGEIRAGNKDLGVIDIMAWD